MNRTKLFPHLRTVLQGMAVGGTMVIPGVSGGSMAIILGIYDKIIHGIGSFYRDKKANTIFFGLLGLGSLLGILLLAKPLEFLLDYYPMAIMYFFMGAVAGSIPSISVKAGAEQFSWRYPFYVALGVAVVQAIGAIPISGLLAEATGLAEMFVMMLAGFIAAFALLLPGISGSYILLMLGIYDDMISAILNFEIAFLLPLLLGMGLGVVVTAKLLEKAMKRYPGVTYLIILGFILGSLVEIFPGIPTGGDLIICPLVFLLGGLGIYWMGRQGSRG